MRGVIEIDEPVNITMRADQMRFMVLTPGGENPRPELHPAQRKVGVRVRKNTEEWAHVMEYRKRLLQHETPDVLGSRKPSSKSRNAFGARHFQPHMTLLRAGSGLDYDLQPIGAAFRKTIGTLLFDRFIIDVKKITLA